MNKCRSTHLWQVPMIQGHNGSDIIFKQLINKNIVVLQSFLIHMVSCKHTSNLMGIYKYQMSCLEPAVQILTPDTSWHDPGPGDGESIMIQIQLFHQQNIILYNKMKQNVVAFHCWDISQHDMNQHGHLDFVVSLTWRVSSIIQERLSLLMSEHIPDAQSFPIFVPGSFCLIGWTAGSPRKSWQMKRNSLKHSSTLSLIWSLISRFTCLTCIIDIHANLLISQRALWLRKRDLYGIGGIIPFGKVP